MVTVDETLEPVAGYAWRAIRTLALGGKIPCVLGPGGAVMVSELALAEFRESQGGQQFARATLGRAKRSSTPPARP